MKILTPEAPLTSCAQTPQALSEANRFLIFVSTA
jgi:hypothetical protein